MINTYTYNNVTWIDLENPSREEIRGLAKKYNIHPLAAEELVLPSTRSKVEVFEDSIYLVLQIPACKNSHRETSQEIDFIIGKSFIVTARYDTIDSLSKFAKMFEVNLILSHNKLIGEHGGFMFYYMMREIYHSIYDELEYIKDNLSDIQKQIFNGHEKEMVVEISNMSRELLVFKHATILHSEVLVSFGAVSKLFFGDKFNHYVDIIEGEGTKIHKTVLGLTETLSEIRETNNALLDSKQNEIMKLFTAVTVISSFLTIISSWFLLDATDRPFKGSVHEFWIIGLIMFTIAIGLAAIMKHKKWL